MRPTCNFYFIKQILQIMWCWGCQFILQFLFLIYFSPSYFTESYNLVDACKIWRCKRHNMTNLLCIQTFTSLQQLHYRSLVAYLPVISLYIVILLVCSTIFNHHLGSSSYWHIQNPIQKLCLLQCDVMKSLWLTDHVFASSALFTVVLSVFTGNIVHHHSQMTLVYWEHS